MNDSFACFYDLSNSKELKNIWKDEQTIFIFDTNVLLSLYSFQPEGRKDFLRILTSLDNRIWIPFHVGLEFHKNRLNVIKNRRKSFRDLNTDIDNLVNCISFERESFTTLQKKFSLEKKYPNVFLKLEESLDKIVKSFNSLEEDLGVYLKEIKDEVTILDKDKIYVNSDDYIRAEIDELFTGSRIGSNTFDTKEKLDALYQEGSHRYKNKIPPGYEDESKGEEEFYYDGLGYKRKFGDLIIFKQIIDFSREKSIKNVIFISEDIKKDWRLVQDQEGSKILGARPELKRELYKEAGVENFFIYQIEEFMQKTNDYLDIRIEKDTLKSIKISLEEDKYQRILEEKIKELTERQVLFDVYKHKKETEEAQDLYQKYVDKIEAIEEAQNPYQLYLDKMIDIDGNEDSYQTYINKKKMDEQVKKFMSSYDKEQKIVEITKNPYETYFNNMNMKDEVKKALGIYEKDKNNYRVYIKNKNGTKKWIDLMEDQDNKDSSDD